MNLALFHPQGPVAAGELALIETAVLVMLIVAIPTLIVLFVIARKYRARSDGGNPRAAQPVPAQPVLAQPRRAWRELILWAIPTVVVAVLAVFTWQSAHALDPYRPIAAPAAVGVAAAQPLTIQVVALPWKWLFIYPAQHIASVNRVQFPAGTPVHFELTADAPMSSFWIPQLGSQMYAMAAMETQLNLMASTTGEFAGKDTEINGAGYAGMTFTAHATSQADFDAWVAAVKAGSLNSVFVIPTLNADEYAALAAPSENNPVSYYGAVEGDLFNTIMMKYMAPGMSEPSEAMHTMY